jgi:hypothetical protein
VALIKDATAVRLDYEIHLLDCDLAWVDALALYDEWGIAQLPNPH